MKTTGCVSGKFWLWTCVIKGHYVLNFGQLLQNMYVRVLGRGKALCLKVMRRGGIIRTPFWPVSHFDVGSCSWFLKAPKCQSPKLEILQTNWYTQGGSCYWWMSVFNEDNWNNAAA